MEYYIWTLSIGTTISCLGLALAAIGLRRRGTMPRVGTRDVLEGRHHPSDAAGQFARYGWILMLAILFVLAGLPVSILLCLWHVFKSM